MRSEGLIEPSRMGYGINDLALFQPLAGDDDRDGSSYFELHPKELPSSHACWLPESLLIRDAAFDFFAECFHTANPAFDYFSITRFGEKEIERLTDELDRCRLDLRTSPSRERLFSRYASLFPCEIWSQFDAQDLAAAVQSCGDGMRNFIRLRTKESRCLWVRGM